MNQNTKQNKPKHEAKHERKVNATLGEESKLKRKGSSCRSHKGDRVAAIPSRVTQPILALLPPCRCPNGLSACCAAAMKAVAGSFPSLRQAGAVATVRTPGAHLAGVLATAEATAVDPASPQPDLQAARGAR
jgi:hypothetical protein